VVIAAPVTRPVGINSDMGESIGIHSFGNDEALLPFVDTINVACGMHAGDPTAMRLVVEQAQAAHVTVGAHPGLPDIAGFGRREMALDPLGARDLIRYQVGALHAFLDSVDMTLHHIKPHGALFSMMAKNEPLMDALCDVALQYGVPVFGLAGTSHEAVATRRGVDFVSEFYVDLDYNDDGTVRVNRTGASHDLDTIEKRVRDALVDGTTTSISGQLIPVRAESFCIHSDLPNAPSVAERVRAVLVSMDTAETEGQGQGHH
jgi:UPF0271 protein